MPEPISKSKTLLWILLFLIAINLLFYLFAPAKPEIQVRSLRNGMTYDKVIHLLGEPMEVRNTGADTKVAIYGSPFKRRTLEIPFKNDLAVLPDAKPVKEE
ncbi:MAG: outer membrane protein assembly factor BamE domain-containing protein [Planctomycetota bacterium]|jgi:hypothetical protein